MTQPRASGPDPVGDFQRWLLRSGVRGVSREVGDQVRTLFGGGRSADVWGSATAPPSEEAPECAWCPVCRAARMLRDSRPGLASQMAAAGGTLASVVQEAVSTVEAALAAAQRAAAANAERAAANTGRATPEDAGPPVPSSAGRATPEDAGPPAPASAGPATPEDAGPPVPSSAGRATPEDAGRAAENGASPEGPPHEPDDRG